MHDERFCQVRGAGLKQSGLGQRDHVCEGRACLVGKSTKSVQYFADNPAQERLEGVGIGGFAVGKAGRHPAIAEELCKRSDPKTEMPTTPTREYTAFGIEIGDESRRINGSRL